MNLRADNNNFKQSGEPSHSGLASLIPNLPIEEFQRSYLLLKPYLFHAPLARLPEIANCENLQSMERFLATIHETREQGFRVRGWFRSPKSELAQVELQARDSAALYLSGSATLVVDGIDKILAPISNLIRDVAQDFSTPMNGITCNAYAAPKSLGSPMHFDPQEVFFLQLLGKKRWKIAPNQHISHPHAHYGRGLPIAPGLQHLVEKFPNTMPKRHQTVTLKPGSVLYMPRGYWHECETLEDSLHLTLTFSSATWIDHLLARLRNQLVLDPKWREPAIGINAEGGLEIGAKERESKLTMELVNYLLRF